MMIRAKESSLPNESALTLLLVLLVLTFILTTIWPREDSCTMHLVTKPLAFVKYLTLEHVTTITPFTLCHQPICSYQSLQYCCRQSFHDSMRHPPTETILFHSSSRICTGPHKMKRHSKTPCPSHSTCLISTRLRKTCCIWIRDYFESSLL